MKVLSWNVRGLGVAMKRVLVKRFVLSHKPAVLSLQETKCEEPVESLVRSIWGIGNLGWEGKASNGASSGLWTIWDASKMRLVSV